MSTEFYNSQWQMPNEVNKNKQANYSLSFNGTDQYITLGSISNINTDFTVSGWINTTNLTNSNYAFRGWFSSGTFNNANQFAINISTLSSYGGVGFINVFEGNSMKIAGTSSVADGNWHHVVLTKTSTQLKLYVDGSLQNTVSNSSTWTWNNVYVGIGNSNQTFGTQGLFDGEISQVCVFNYALSQNQVTTLYGTGSAIGDPMSLSPAPKAYYKLSDSVWDGSEYITANNAAQDYVFDYDGVGAVTTSSINLGKRNTISFWIKKDAIGDQYWFASGTGNLDYLISSFASSGNNAGIFIRPSVGGNQILASNAATITALNNTDARFVNWTFVRDSDTTVRLFADGVFLESITGANWASYDTLTVLQRVGSYDIDGKVSNIKLFDTNLSDSEVETLYNYGSPIRTLANIPQNSNLKAWYKLDASEVYNSSSTKWEINNAASPWTTALKLDGTSDYIDTNNTVTFTSFSVSIWFKASSTSTTQFIVSTRTGTGGSSKGFSIYLSGNILYMRAYRPGSNGQVYVGFTDTTSWHNAVLTYDGSAVRGYLNGSALVDSPDAIAYEASDANMDIGARTGFNSASKFEGLISNASLWNDDLTLAQVLEIYNGGNPSSNLLSHSANSNLVSWWKLDNTTSGVEDSKGSRNGTVEGTPTKEQSTVTTINGLSSGMNQSNLVQSDLQTVAPLSLIHI